MHGAAIWQIRAGGGRTLSGGLSQEVFLGHATIRGTKGKAPAVSGQGSVVVSGGGDADLPGGGSRQNLRAEERFRTKQSAPK